MLLSGSSTRSLATSGTERSCEALRRRRPDAVTERTCELLGEVQQRSPGLGELAFETILSVAPSPGHPLNADFLHETAQEYADAQAR